MAFQTIRIKNTNVAGKVPTAGQLDTAELVLNLKDQKLYSKDADGVVFELGQKGDFVKLDDEGTAQDITGGGGLTVSTGAGATGTRIGVAEDGSAAVGYFQTVRTVTGAGDVAQFTGQDGSVTFKGEVSSIFNAFLDTSSHF